MISFTLSVDDTAQTFGLTAKIHASVSAERVLGYMQQSLRNIVDALSEQLKPGGHEEHVLAPVAWSMASDGPRPRSSKKWGRQTHSEEWVAPVESVVVLNGHCVQASTCDWFGSGEKVPFEHA